MVYMKHPMRRQHILNAALRIAQKKLFTEITQTDVAKAAECSPSLVRFYFGDMDNLRDEVMAEAVRTKDCHIIAQGVILRHPKVRRLPADLKKSALAAV